MGRPLHLPFGVTIPPQPMARKTDPETSHAAADAVLPMLNKIHRLVLAAYRHQGPMSARQCERLPEFEDYAPSTIRKRISELARAGRLVEDGVDTEGRSPATIYRLAGGGGA